MEGKIVTYKAKLGEKVINKVNVLTTQSPVSMVTCFTSLLITPYKTNL